MHTYYLLDYEKIRQLVYSNFLSLAEFSRKCGLSQVTIYGLKKAVRPQTMWKIANHLKVSPNEIIRGKVKR